MFLVLVIELIGFGIAIPVLPFLAKDFGASGLVVGLLFAAQAAGQFALAPAWGTLSDRVGRKPVMVATLLCAAGASYLTALSGSLLWLFVARVLAGMAAGNVSTASAYITDVTDAEDRSKGMAVIGISFGLGFMLGPAIGAFLAQMGNALVFEVTAGISAANAVVAALVLREPRRRRSREEVRGGAPLRALLRRSATARVLSIALVYSVSITLMESMFAYYALETFGYGPRQVGFILAGLALVMVAVQGGGVSRLSKRLGDRAMTGAGLLMLGVGVAAAVVFGEVAWLVVCLMVASVGRALAHPGLMSLTSQSVDSGSVGRVMGLFQSTNSLGRIVGPAVGGAFFLWDPRAPFALAGVMLVAAVGVWWVVQGRARSADEGLVAERLEEST